MRDDDASRRLRVDPTRLDEVSIAAAHYDRLKEQIVTEGVKLDAGSADDVRSLDSQWSPAARRAGLRIWAGRLTEDSPHHVVVGRLLGDFGVEGRHTQLALTDSEFLVLASSTRDKLTAAGVPGEPALHLLFEARC